LLCHLGRKRVGIGEWLDEGIDQRGWWGGVRLRGIGHGGRRRGNGSGLCWLGVGVSLVGLLRLDSLDILLGRSRDREGLYWLFVFSSIGCHLVEVLLWGCWWDGYGLGLSILDYFLLWIDYSLLI
jgi:hypothetical protein